VKHREATAEHKAAARLTRIRALDHKPRAFAQGVEGAVQAYRQQIVPFGRFHVDEGAWIGVASRIGKDAIEPAEIGLELLVGLGDLFFGSDVDLIGHDPARARRQQFGLGHIVLLGIARPDCDIAAHLGAAHGEAEADPAIAAGDHGHFASAIEQAFGH
jgi:hypothetical protein